MTSPGRQMFAASAPTHVDVGDAELAYFRFGSGPPLLCVHGWPLSSLTWRHVLPELARHFTVVLPDLAGAGLTQWTSRTDFRFVGQAARLQKLLHHLGWESCGVLAQDTGATVARQLALMEPGRIRKLALLNTEIPGHRPPWIELFQLSTRLPLAQASFRMLLASRGFRRSSMGFGGCFVDPALMDGEFHDCFVSPLLTSDERLAGQIRYLQGITWPLVDDLKERHRDIAAEVLFIWGEDDPTFPAERGREMVSQLRRCAGFVTVPGARLLLHEEKPAEVARHAIGFLA